MPDLSTDDQRREIVQLFDHFGVRDVEQVRADAARILKIEYLPGLRELAAADADELIGELRRALAQERVSDA
jgi:DNA polymerase/3'-5' exonuclease PolX